jgi:hypothetical protein
MITIPGHKTDKNIKKKRTENSYKNAVIFFIIVIMGIVPLYVRAHYIKLTEKEKSMWFYTDYIIDYFNFYKSRLLIISVVLILLIFIILLMKKKLKITVNIYCIFLCLFALILIISTILSVDINTSLKGHISRFEGLYTYMAYIMFSFLVIQFLKNIKSIEIIIKYTLIISFIISIIGILQVYNINIFNMDFFKKIIIPIKYHQNMDKMSLIFKDEGIFATLYNPNYVGSYSALLLPVSICFFLYKKKKTEKIILYIVIMFLFAMLTGSLSRAGYLGFGTVFIIMLIVFIIRKDRVFRGMAALIAGFIAVFFILSFTSESGYLKEVVRLNPASEFKEEVSGSQNIIINNILFDENKALIKTSNGEFIIEVLETGLNIYDQNNELLDIKEENGVYIINEKDYSFFKFEIVQDRNLLKIMINNKVFYLTFNNLEMKILGGNGMELKTIKNAVVENRLPIGDSFASHRGYTWRRTIPLIYKKPFLGYGLDTFIYVFPQHDYIGKINSTGSVTRLISKPHNLYLQIAVSGGLFALMIFILFILFLFIKAVKQIFIKKRECFILIGVTASIFAYLITGIFNDSLVGVAPIFWGFTGIAIVLTDSTFISNEQNIKR